MNGFLIKNTCLTRNNLISSSVLVYSQDISPCLSLRSSASFTSSFRTISHFTNDNKKKVYNGDIIDPHIHLWDLNKLNYPWLKGSDGHPFIGNIDSIRKNYLLEDLINDSKRINQKSIGFVHVQAECDDAIAEVEWIDSVARSILFGGTGSREF